MNSTNSMDAQNPNFPSGLDIKPLVSEHDDIGYFNTEMQKKSIERFGIAGRIWEAAQIVTRYFELSESPEWQFDPRCTMLKRDDRNLTIAELGSGTGYVGLKLAEKLAALERTRDLLILTDLSDVCPLLEETLDIERQKWTASHMTGMSNTPVKIVPLPWGDTTEAHHLSKLLNDEGGSVGEPRYLTHLVCSDLVYFPHLLAPLLRSLLQLTSPPFSQPGHSPEILISYKIRSLSKESAFWSAFGLWFTFSPVLVRRAADDELQNSRAGSIPETRGEHAWHIFGTDGFIFIGHRRPESTTWAVPDNNDDLLSGIGTRDSEIPQSDDTFETLLMMQLGDYDDVE